MQGQARPGVQQAQDFAHHIESIAGGAPPVPGIERIVRGGAHDGQTLPGSEPAPKQANATRMGLGRNNNNGAVLPGRESSRDGSDFVDGIHDRRFEDVNGFRRHSFLNENELVVIVLAGERNAHAFQSFTGLGGIGKPDFRRVPCAVKFRGLDGAQRDRAAEHDDRPGFHERVFHHQPTAEPEEQHYGEDHAGANDHGEDSPSAKPRTRDPSGMDWSCHLGTGACYPAPPKRSTGGARVTVYDGRCSLSVPGPTSAPSERATASLMAACSPMAETGGGLERGLASKYIFFQTSKSYLKLNSSLSLSRERSKSLPTKARLPALRGGMRFWAMALKSLPRTKLMSVAVMKRPVRVVASSEPRRSDSTIWRSARAWKTQRDGWSCWRNIRQVRPSAKENWQREESSMATRERDCFGSVMVFPLAELSCDR